MKTGFAGISQFLTFPGHFLPVASRISCIYRQTRIEACFVRKENIMVQNLLQNLEKLDHTGIITELSVCYLDVCT